MLEKFPSKVEPVVWWPKQQRTPTKTRKCKNGWNVKLEEEMREIVNILEVKDKADYFRLGEKSLKLHKGLAIAGPLLTGLEAIGSVFLLLSPHSTWAMLLGVMGGAVGSVVNSLERSLLELRDIAASSSTHNEEFGSKLF
ncbi:putative petal formation-expressed [Helianthus debilis subsp. tardiflorus]